MTKPGVGGLLWVAAVAACALPSSVRRMIRRFVAITVLPLLLPVLGCGADEGEQADAESLARLFCRTTLGVDETAQPEQFSSCVRRTLPPATVYSDCLAGAGEFAVESEMFDCEDEADWSPYEDRSQ